MINRPREKKNNFVLALGAHPDDLELGCGGTLASLAAAGVRVVMAIVSVPNRLALRKQESQRAAEILGCEVRFLVPNKTSRVEDLKNYELVGLIDELVAELKPVAVFSHCQSNIHLDHRLVYEATLASQRIRYFHHFSYSPTSCRPMNITFSPNTFIDVSDKIDLKKRAIQAHFSQFGERSLDFSHVHELDRRNGILIGAEYAEGFQVERQKLELAMLAAQDTQTNRGARANLSGLTQTELINCDSKDLSLTDFENVKIEKLN